MNTVNKLLYESSVLMAGSDNIMDVLKAQTILEDVNSPKTTRHTEELFTQVIKKGHIDFDDIPRSKGDIKAYSGYSTMMNTLTNMENLAGTNGMKSDAVECVENVIKAITNIAALSDVYGKGYDVKNEYVMLEYNTYVYCCVQATSSLLSEFVEFAKGLDRQTLDLKLKNNKYRANLFYVEQLTKFNNVVASTEYRKFLTEMMNGKDNFTGAMVIGIAAVTTVALSIVPITRSIVYRICKLRMKVSDALALQAYFLEMNRACVEANTKFTAAEKKKILQKQEYLRKLFLKMSDKLRVDNARADREAQNDKKKDDKDLSSGNQSRDDSPLGDLL